jgi:hypothetical protein
VLCRPCATSFELVNVSQRVRFTVLVCYAPTRRSTAGCACRSEHDGWPGKCAGSDSTHMRHGAIRPRRHISFRHSCNNASVQRVRGSKEKPSEST